MSIWTKGGQGLSDDVTTGCQLCESGRHAPTCSSNQLPTISFELAYGRAVGEHQQHLCPARRATMPVQMGEEVLVTLPALVVTTNENSVVSGSK